MTRSKNKQDMTITEQLEAVKEKMCDSYCKYREEYFSCYKDPDEAYEHLLEDMCESCPMSEL